MNKVWRSQTNSCINTVQPAARLAHIEMIALKHFILAFLKQLLTLTSGLGTKKKLCVLIYHRVLNEADFMRPGEVDKQVFAWQMALLAKYFNVLPVSEALEQLKTNRLPARAVCITFDDGYADNLLNAAPILQQHQLSALFFIASGYLNGGRMWNDSIIEAIRNLPFTELDLTHVELGRHLIATPTQKQTAAHRIIQQLKYLEPAKRMHISKQIADLSHHLPDDLMLSHKQLKQLHQQGMEIGGHTVSHPIMAKLDTNTVVQEVKDNKNTLEQLLNTEIRYFAYPNGKLNTDYLPSHIDVIKNAGYHGAFSTHWGVATFNSDIWQLPRFTPWDTTPIKFMLRMASHYWKGK